jgi:hypothetical protein
MSSERLLWRVRGSQCRPPAMGGYLPLAPGVSTVRYPIPERIFDYVSTVRSATAGTCHKRTMLRGTTDSDNGPAQGLNGYASMRVRRWMFNLTIMVY